MRGRAASFAAAAAAAALLAAPAAAEASDAPATSAYLQANYRLVRFAVEHLETAQVLIEGVQFRVEAECPAAARRSPQDSESTELSNEVIGTMVVTGYRAARPEIDAYLASAERQTWSSPALAHTIRAYDGKLRVLLSLHTPRLCADVQAWARAGFAHLASSTVAFDARFMPNWVALGLLPAQLSRSAGAADKALLARSTAAEERITEFEASAVPTWGNIMNALELWP